MIAYSKKVRILLLCLVCLCLAGAYLSSQGDQTLPYGQLASPVFTLIFFAGAGIAAAFFYRCRALFRSLAGAERFRLPVEEIPRRPGSTFLARGFPWEEKHLERLQSLILSGMTVSSRTRDDHAGNVMIQGVGAEEARDLFIPDTLLNQHLFVLGAPGSGKTRFLELLIEQAIARGEAVVVIDPKGDERLLDRTYDSAVRHGRVSAFRTLALPFPYQSARYNPVLHYTRPSEIADRVALVLPRGGESEAFRNYAWTFTNIIAGALSLLDEEVTLAKLNTYLFHDTWKLVRKIIRRFCPGAPDTSSPDLLLEHYRTYCEEKRTSIPELDALVGMASINPDYFGKISSALRPILGKLTTKGIGYLLCPGDIPAPEGTSTAPGVQDLSWEEVDSNGLIVYFFLGSLIGEDTASGVARMALSDLQSFIGRKYAYRDPSRFSRMTVIVDEVADALASESVNILNKARGAGLSMILAGQSIADLEVALRSHSDARRALANIGSFITLRAANPEDARYFSDKCGWRPLRTLSVGESYEPALFSSGRSNIDDFAYRNSRQVGVRNDPLVPTWAIDELPRFHFFATWSGQTYKAVLPVLSDPAPTMSDRLKAIPEVKKSDPTSEDPAPGAARREAA